MSDRDGEGQRVRPIPMEGRGGSLARSVPIGVAALGVAALAALVFFTFWLAPGTEGDAPVLASPDSSPTSAAGPDDSRPDTTVSAPQTGGLVFSRPLPWTLVFDNGSFGVEVVDLNENEVVVRDVEGARGGDQPFRLTVHDGHLVVGWGEIYAYDISSGESSQLAEATIHVPAAAPSRVWIVDYPGGSIGLGSPEVWQVHVAGGQSTERQVLDIDGFPAHGIPGGVALESESGILLWDSEAGAAVGTLGTRTGFVSDVTVDGKLAWCQDPCDEMRITTLADNSEIAVRHPNSGVDFDARGARFSDDGRYLAAPADRDVVVIDTATGESRTAITFPVEVEPLIFVAWAPEGEVLFAASYSYEQSETAVGYYSVVSNRAEVSTLRHGGTLSFVVVPAYEADQLLGIGPPVEPEETSGRECPLTIPQSLFTPPEQYPPDPVPEGLIWYGTDELWTILEIDGTTGHRKSVWWSADFPGGVVESDPEIGVIWERLDDSDQDVIVDEPPGTNAFTEEDGDFMIAGIDPDIEGCWRVTATYKGATLPYVYRVP